MKEINAGLIGYKFMGRAHSNAFRQVNHFFNADAKINLKAICGRDKISVQNAASKFGFESYETDWKKLIDRDDIDFVDITSPGNLHSDMALYAAYRKKHIFCEKPLANDSAKAFEMWKAAKAAGIKHQVGFNYRFVPAILLAKKLIDDGRLGTIYHFRGLYLQDWIVDPEFPLVWRLDKTVAGSGAHGDINAHIIDLAHYLVGDMKKVIGMQKTFIRKRPIVETMDGLKASGSSDAALGEVTVDDASVFMTEFQNGALGTFEATRFATGRKNGMSFEINGSKGSVKFEFEKMNELQYYNNDDPATEKGFRVISVTEDSHAYAGNWWPPGHIIGYEHTFVHEMFEFVQSIANDRAATPDFEDGYKCCRILDAVDTSIKDGQWINV
ncbi:MAG: Gfo/Idh/MocA family oxidoreductase [Clostridia bacterium]|nr:Gfo/Idh/MocA family oxidoreductase [Clostridia bacterium]MBN2884264.1 Gfo/Idh/MocA family oxidoreductase [Clostridia bacterium]